MANNKRVHFLSHCWLDGLHPGMTHRDFLILKRCLRLDLMAVLFSLHRWHRSPSKHVADLEMNVRGQPASFGGPKRINPVSEPNWMPLFCRLGDFKRRFKHPSVAVDPGVMTVDRWPLTFVIVFFFTTPLTINRSVSSGHGWLPRQSQHAHTTPIIISGLRF